MIGTVRARKHLIASQGWWKPDRKWYGRSPLSSKVEHN